MNAMDVFLAGITSPPILTKDQLFEICAPKYEVIKPYLIDHWPESVLAVSCPTTLVPLGADEGEMLFDYCHPDWKANAARVADRLDEVMDWDHYFIRLNTRSPKDTGENLVTSSGRQAVSLISRSERCLDDIVLLNNARQPIYIALRKPIIPLFKEAEFRCFAKDGLVIAVSRYHEADPVEPVPGADLIMGKVRDFYHTHLQSHYPTVVFDIHFDTADHITLIELNPYGMSDPVCFGSYEEVEKGGVRFHGTAPPPQPVPAIADDPSFKDHISNEDNAPPAKIYVPVEDTLREIRSYGCEAFQNFHQIIWNMEGSHITHTIPIEKMGVCTQDILSFIDRFRSLTRSDIQGA